MKYGKKRTEVYIRSVLLRRSDDRGSARNIIRNQCTAPVMKYVKSVMVRQYDHSNI